MAVHPRVMMFDEVTSALEPELIWEVLRAVEQLADGGMTMPMVTREMGFAGEAADDVIFMDGGGIVEGDKPNGIFGNPWNGCIHSLPRAVLASAWRG